MVCCFRVNYLIKFAPRVSFPVYFYQVGLSWNHIRDRFCGPFSVSPSSMVWSVIRKRKLLVECDKVFAGSKTISFLSHHSEIDFTSLDSFGTRIQCNPFCLVADSADILSPIQNSLP